MITGQAQHRSLVTNSQTKSPKDHFGDVFEDFVFLDTGAGKLEALSKYKSSNMFWIEDKSQNAFTGATQGLVALLLDPPTMQAIIVIMNFL